MPAPAADQDSLQDAFLQPVVSHSSPIRRRGRSQGHLPPAAASADLADLVKDYNALSARCRASEQQLAQARKELSKERQRSRQLRASYDALTIGSLQSGRQLHQHRASTVPLHSMPTAQGPDSHAAPHIESHRIISESPTHTNSSSNNSSQEDVRLHGPLQLPRAAARAPAACLPLGPLMAGPAANRIHRWSTDTNVADQARSSANSSSSTSSSIIQALSSCQEGSPVADKPQPPAAQPAAAVAPVAPAAATSTAEDVAGTDGQVFAVLADGIQSAALAADSSRFSPLKRAAQDHHQQQQQQQQPFAASPCSSGSASPKKHKQLPPKVPSSSSRAHQQPPVAGNPLATPGDLEADDFQPAAEHGAQQQGQQQQGQQQQGQQQGEQQKGQQQGPQQQQQGQQPRQVSKRPAEQLWAQPEQQPSERATRRLRTAGSSSSSKQAVTAAAPASSDAAECRRQPAVGAGVPLEHQQQQAAGAVEAAAVGDGINSSTQQTTTPPPPSSGSRRGPVRLPAASVSRSQFDSDCGPVAGSADSPTADVDTATAATAAPAMAAAAAEPAVGPEQHVSHPAAGAASSSTSTYRPSRLSASSNAACTALAIVPVPSSSSSSHRSRAYSNRNNSSRYAVPQHNNRNSSARHDRAQFDASDADRGCQSDIPAGGPANAPDASGHQSYGRRAAKAAKAVAKKLRNMFIGGSSSGTGGSAGNASNAGDRSAPAAAGSTGGRCGINASSSSGRESDLRRSWQGPFFSSRSAARAAEQQGQDADGSRDNSHAEHKGGKGKRWKPPKWARKYSGYSSDSSSDCGEGDPMFDEDPFGPGFSPLRHNFAQRHPQHKQQGSAAGPRDSPFTDPFGPAFSPLRQSMGFKPSGQQQDPAAAAADDNDGFGPDWLGID